MEPERRARLEEIMGQLADGDEAMVFALVNEFGTELARQVRHIARTAGRALSQEELHNLVLDSALALSDVAKAWRPDGGALPWTWARGRVRNAVFAELFGPFPVDPGDLAADDDPEGSSPVGRLTHEPDWSGVLSDLADCDPETARFVEVFDHISERDRLVYLEFRLLQSVDSPSPAETVSEMTGLRADNVRQIVRRVRQKLRAGGLERIG